MTIVRRISAAAALAGVTLIGVGLSIPPAQAGFVLTLDQVGSNVVATGSGTIDLTGLSFYGLDINDSFLKPNTAEVLNGPPATEPPESAYNGFSGPTSFGSGSSTIVPNIGSGDQVGIWGTVVPALTVPVLWVPEGYSSGDPLSDTSTYDNATFSSLGVAPGTYVWTWGSGATDDTFTLQIGSSAAVPEPSALLLLGTALAGLPLTRTRRTRASR
jgi:hypothetical protein